MGGSNSFQAARDSARTETLQDAILKVLLYADIFDYPLSASEVFRYLNVPARPEQVELALAATVQQGSLARSDGLYSLPERRHLAATRARRSQVSKQVWPHARRYARLIASLPFVEMVAVTGALAVDNIDADADIDFMIVCAPGRVWLVRALTGITRRLAQAAGHRICPNYILASSVLELDERNLYAARELFQMVPLYGLDVYRRLIAANCWALSYLPNITSPPLNSDGHQLVDGPLSPLRRALELGLSGPLGRRLQQAEWQRWRRKAARHEHIGPEVVLAPDRFKMHDLGHGGRILALYAERLASYGLSFPAGGQRTEDGGPDHRPSVLRQM